MSIMTQEQISLVPGSAQGGSAVPSGPSAVTCVPVNVPVHQQDFKAPVHQQDFVPAKRLNGAQAMPGLPPNACLPVEGLETPCALERDYYGCYCLKFIVKNGTHITEDKVMEDFGTYGEVVDVRGPGLFSGLRGNHVYVRFIDKLDAEEALRQLIAKYHQLTPASISDVLPDNYGLYTISFYNKTGIPSTEVRREFSKFGEVKNLTGSLDVKGGRVFVSYKNKNSAVEALQAFFFRKDRYPNMKFALPRCEKDYFGCYCLKFYNKTGEVTEQQVLEDFGMYGEVVDVRGPGLFDVTGDDVYVRYKEKSSAEQALIELVGRYDSLCLAPPSDIQADKFGYYTITFVNDKCLSKSDVWYIFSKFGTVACVNGTFDCKKGRVFVSYKEKQGALNALETMLITKEYHLQVSKNSTVRKNDYNIVTNPKENDNVEFDLSSRHERAHSEQKQMSRERSGSREASCGPAGHRMTNPPPALPRQQQQQQQVPQHMEMSQEQVQQQQQGGPPPPPNHIHPKFPIPHLAAKNGLVKFNRNVEKDIFGYFCLSFLNEDGEISEKKVRHDFSKFGEVVSVRGALGKQKGHVFVRFRKKEAAENCLNCLNSFPLSEMSELFGRYLFLSPATPRDIDCDMFGLYSISFLNLNIRTFREIRAEFSKFGEIVRLTSGGGGNTDELVSISYSDKGAAVRALQTHFTNKDYPYLDIAKGSSLLLVNSSDSSDCEDHEGDSVRLHHNSLHPHHQELLQDRVLQNRAPGSRPHSADRVYHHGHGHHHGGNSHHDPFRNNKGAQAGSDVVDELLKPLQSYFSVFRTGQYQGGGGHHGLLDENGGPPAHNTRSHDKRYRIRKNQQEQGGKGNKSRGGDGNPMENGHHGHPPPHHLPGGLPNMTGPPPAVANGYGPPHVHGGPPPMLGEVETEIAHSLPPPNMAEPPPGMLGAPPYPPPQQALLLLPSVSAPPPHIGSPQQQTSPPYPVPAGQDAHDDSALDAASSLSEEEQLEVGVSNISLSDLANNVSEEQEEQQQGEDAMVVEDEQPKLDDEADEEDVDVADAELPPQPPTKDIFNLFSLAFACKSKDLSERRIRLEFGLVAEVCRVRGQPGKVDATVIVSFESVEDCMKCLEDRALRTKFPSLGPAPDVKIVPDRDGYFSIEFTNAGMSGVREITNEFSRHGEIVKVQQGGARNAVKRVTVSYADLDSAMAALTHYANSNDYRGITFTHECECVEMDT